MFIFMIIHASIDRSKEKLIERGAWDDWCLESGWSTTLHMKIITVLNYVDLQHNYKMKLQCHC